MFRELRREKQALSFEENVQILNRGTSGVLAVSGDEDYPYAVPLSYAYCEDKIFFHCAKTGHKLDAIAKNPKVSFCVIDRDQIVEEEYTTYFRSVILFGRARILEDEAEIRAALLLLSEKYSPGQGEASHAQVIERTVQRVNIIELSVEHMSGKQAKELMRT